MILVVYADLYLTLSSDIPLGLCGRKRIDSSVVSVPPTSVDRVAKIDIRETLLPTIGAKVPLLNSTAALLLPQSSEDAAENCILPANERVTDGARTRDLLLSHNPPTPVSEYYPILQNRFT